MDQDGERHADSVENTLRGQTPGVYGGAGYTESVSPASQQTGYYFNQTPQLNPSQAYNPYYNQQPPLKIETDYYSGPPAGANEIPPLVTSVTPAPAPDTTARERRIWGMSMTAFLLLCVIGFLLVSGVILGGVFGSGVLDAKHIDPTPQPLTISSTSTTATTATTATTTTITSSSSTIPASSPTATTFIPYALPTGVWDLQGSLVSTVGECIPTINSTIFQEVWACKATESHQITIHDMTTDSVLDYWLDLEGTNIKGISGEPPTDNEDNSFWIFRLPEITVMSPDVPTGCEVQSTLIFILNSDKDIYAFDDIINSTKACLLPSGQMSLPGLSCGCVYGSI